MVNSKIYMSNFLPHTHIYPISASFVSLRLDKKRRNKVQTNRNFWLEIGVCEPFISIICSLKYPIERDLATNTAIHRHRLAFCRRDDAEIFSLSLSLSFWCEKGTRSHKRNSWTTPIGFSWHYSLLLVNRSSSTSR